jgi:hypothetical protein
MALYKKNAGTWQSVNDLRIKSGGNWNQVQEAWIKSGGSWSKFWSLATMPANALFIAGGFSLINSNLRQNNLSIVDNVNGSAVSSFMPSISAGSNITVSSVAVSGTTVYFGGQFTVVNSYPRGHWAAVDSLYGNLLPWNPNAGTGSTQTTLEISGTRIFLGGSYVLMNTSVTRNRICSVDPVIGTLDAWDPNANGAIFSIDFRQNADEVYVGGQFTTLGGISRNRLGCVTASGTGTATSWDPNISTGSSVNTARVSGDVIYVGGQFTGVRGSSRQNMAAFTLNTTGSLTTWAPVANNLVYAIDFGSDATVYAGGLFTTINSQVKKFLAGINPSGGGVTTSFSANITGDASNIGVYGLVVNNSNIYTVGNFAVAGTVASPSVRVRAAAFDSTGTLQNWNPGIGSTVLASAIGRAIASSSGSNFIIGGDFLSVNGTGKYGVAAFNADTSANFAILSNVNLNCYGNTTPTLNALVIDNGTLYFGGTFYKVQETARANLASVTVSNGAITTWAPNPNSTVNCIATSGNLLYIGGDFTSVSSVSRFRTAAIDKTTATAAVWNISANSTVLDILPYGPNIFVGGLFNQITINGTNVIKRGLCVTDTSGTGRIINYFGETNSNVRTITNSGSNIYIGGDFSRFLNLTRSLHMYRGVTTNTTGSFVKSFDVFNGVNITDQTRTLQMSGSNLYIGGSFSSFEGISRPSLACYDLNSLTVTSWSPSASVGATVTCMAISAGVVYIGGNFTTLSGQTRNSLGCVTVSGGEANGWNPVTSGANINVICLSGNTAYIGGNLTVVGGQPRSHLAAVTTFGTGDPLIWAPASNSTLVNSIAVSGSSIYVGGSFTTLAGVSRQFIGGVTASGTGDPLLWNPIVNGAVNTVLTSSNKVFFAGQFTAVNGLRRFRAACVDTSGTGNLMGWDPSIGGANVTNMITGANTTLVLMGNFGSVGISGANIALNPGLSGSNIVYVNSISGDELPWTPFRTQTGGLAVPTVYTAAICGDSIFVGGDFGLGYNWKARTSVASFESSVSGALNDWLVNFVYNGGLSPPKINVITIDPSSSKFYIGGYFGLDAQSFSIYPVYPQVSGPLGATITGGVGNNAMICKFDKNNGDSTEIAAISGNGTPVTVMNICGTNIFVSGLFTTLNGNSRINAGCVDIFGNIKPWNPSPNSYCRAIELSGGTAFMGGNFVTVQGGARSGGAAVTVTGAGTLLAWNPSTTASAGSASNVVYSILPSGNRIYLSGRFDFVNFTTKRTNVACVDPVVGTVNPVWSISADNFVYSLIDAGNNNICLGGSFRFVQGKVRSAFAMVDASGTGNVLPACIPLGGGNTIFDVALSGTNLMTLGSWNFLSTPAGPDGSVIKVFAMYDISSVPTSVGPDITASLIPYNIGYNDATLSISRILRNGTNTFIWADGATIGEYVSNDILKIDISGGLNKFYPGNTNLINQFSYDAALTSADPGFVYTATNSTLKSYMRRCAVAVDISGNVLPWNPGFNGEVYTIVKDISGIYCGGNFTTVDGTQKGGLVLTDPIYGYTLDNTTINGPVRAIAINHS